MKQKLVTAHFPFHGKDSLMTVLFEDGKAAEMYLTPAGGSSILGNVYVGKIEKVQKSAGGAFVRLSDHLTGYLPFREGLKAGMEIPVQVEKEALKQKLPRLTENIRIAGRYLVLSSGRSGVHTSSKLSPEQKEETKKIFTRALKLAEEKSPEKAPEMMCKDASASDDTDVRRDAKISGRPSSASGNAEINGSLPFGVILRTNASGCSPERLADEYLHLISEMEEILLLGRTRTCGTCIWRGETSWERLAQRIPPENRERIVTDDPAVFKDLSACDPVLYDDPMVRLYKVYSFSKLLTEASSKKVWLKSGGFLVIEQTEAFVCIDVNTGRYCGKKEAEETAILTNREAAEEAVRQIRLRQLSGTILIDFINLHDKQAVQDLLLYTQEQLQRDHEGAKVIDITPLGIMEITRRKEIRSLAEQMQAICSSDAV